MQAFTPTYPQAAEQGWIELVTCWDSVKVRADGPTFAARADRCEDLSQAVLHFLDRAPEAAGQCFVATASEGLDVRTWWPSENACRRFRTEWATCLAIHDRAASFVVDLIGAPDTASRELARSKLARPLSGARVSRVAC